MGPVFFVFAAAAVAGLVGGPSVRQGTQRLALLDRPDGGRKRHASPVPLGGGLLLLGAMSAGLAAGYILDAPLPPVAVLASAVLLFGVGLVDDLYCLRPGRKFAGQLLALFPMVWLGPRIMFWDLFGMPTDAGPAGQLLLLAWLVAGVNAANFLDGMDGLCGGMGLLIASAAWGCGIFSGASADTVLAAALAGALIGFLRENRPPARLYLGDAGSMPVGLLCAYLAVRCTASAPATLSLAPAAALLWLPIWDLVLAVVRRGLTGQPVWQGDRGHVHHVLLQEGRSIRGALVRLIGLAAAACLAGLLAVVLRQPAWAWAALGLLPAGAAALRLAGHREARLFAARLTRLSAAPWRRTADGGTAEVRIPAGSFEAEPEPAVVLLPLPSLRASAYRKVA